ncbi:MAG: hypothetical protein CBC08_07240 [Flavobacteriaceae bacterium TMED48]|jgi:uncharacterized membrane protein|nr:MAG: hypothetical protein CBC08_07240 [Flavobacteriaceae bacterium TMED48]
MQMEQLAEFLIQYIHAPLGGIALLSGGISLISKKGSSLHKKSGKVFFYSMFLSAFSALVVSFLPNHESPFLFSIGLFITYFLVSGIRCLKYKQKEIYLSIDKIIALLNKDKLDMLYQFMTTDIQLKAGKAIAKITLSENQKIKLRLD